MKVNIPKLYVLEKTFKKFEATKDKKAIIYFLSPMGKKSGYLSVKYYEPKKEIFERGQIWNATGDIKIVKRNPETNKFEVVLVLEDFESITLAPPKEEIKLLEYHPKVETVEEPKKNVKKVKKTTKKVVKSRKKAKKDESKTKLK